MKMTVQQTLGSCRNYYPQKPFFPWLWWEVLGPLGLCPRDLHASAIAQGGVCVCVGRGVAFPERWLNFPFPPLLDRR